MEDVEKPPTKNYNTSSPTTAVVADEKLEGKAGGNSLYGDEGIVTGMPIYDDAGSDCDPEAKANLGKFVTQGYKDVWAAVLFIIAVILTFYFGISNFQSNLDYIHTHKAHVESSKGQDGKTHHSVKVDTVEDDGHGLSAKKLLIGTFGITMVASVSAIAILLILHHFPRKAIITANVAVCFFYLILGFYLLSAGSMWGGVICIIVAPLNLLWLYLVRDRIPFATLILKISTKLIMRYKATIFVSIMGVLTFYAYSVVNLSMSFPMLHRIGEKQATGSDFGLYLLCTLFFFWAAQVCINVVHVTVAGLVATWYFVGDDQMPPNPTLASFKRSVTTSFGSICFGSLLVAIVQTMRRALHLFKDHENDFVRCIVDCLLSILEALLEYFNTYAYVHVAIYGVSYIEAAKRTWALAKECGWKAYFNDCLIEPTISLTSLGMAILMGGIAGLIFGAAAGFMTFIAVFAVCLTVLRCVDSAVPTIFVCYAELPQALLAVNPELYNMLHASDYGQRVV